MVWSDGGPCTWCSRTRAAVWYGGADGDPYCHLRPCLRAGGYLPEKGQGGKRGRRAAHEDEHEEEDTCTKITKICGVACEDPGDARSKKARRNAPPTDELWCDVLGTFRDVDDDADGGGLDRRWVALRELLLYISKAEVKKALAAWEKESSSAAATFVTRFRRPPGRDE